MEQTQPHVPMIVCPRPFTLEGRQARVFTPGLSIADLLREFDYDPETLPARVFLDDQLIEKAYWHRIRPKAGHLVSVRVIPEGGSNQSKDILRIVAMVGILALAVFVPPAIGLTGATALFAGAGIGIVGNLALSGPIPPPLPRRSIPLPQKEDRRLAA